MITNIYLGADHAGFHLKNSLLEHLQMQGAGVIDLGAHTLDPLDDYPLIAKQVASRVAAEPGSIGVLCCGNAEGVCIAANKFDGVRAGIGYSIDAAESMREEDHVNILCLPGRTPTQDDPLAILDAFLAAEPQAEERYLRRLGQISGFEQDN